MRTTIIVIAYLLLQNSAAIAGNTTIRNSDFGDEWPFTVNEGVLNCPNREITFASQGVVYGVNGTAISAGRAPVDPIWAFDMKTINELAEALDMSADEVMKSSPMRVNIGPIINRGLTLCK